MRVAREGSIKLSLRGGTGTGYAWLVTFYDVAVIEQIGDSEFIPDPAPPGFVGGPGTFVLRFGVTGPGSTDLRLIYARGWEGDPQDSFQVTIQVP